MLGTNTLASSYSLKISLTPMSTFLIKTYLFNGAVSININYMPPHA